MTGEPSIEGIEARLRKAIKAQGHQPWLEAYKRDVRFLLEARQS